MAPRGRLLPDELEAVILRYNPTGGLVIDPATCHYMGSKEVAVKDHLDTASLGSRLVKAGTVLSWRALLGDAIVRHPGQLP